MDNSDTEPRRRAPYKWADLPPRAQRERARELIGQLLTGTKRRDAMHWLNRRCQTAHALENFIRNMEAGLAARQEGAT